MYICICIYVNIYIYIYIYEAATVKVGLKPIALEQPFPNGHVCEWNGHCLFARVCTEWFLPSSDSFWTCVHVKGRFCQKNIAFYSKRRSLFLACVFAILVLTACGAVLGEAVLVRTRWFS